jgi:hypothetical protein
MNRLSSAFIAALAVFGLVRAQEATIGEVVREPNLESSKTFAQTPGLMPKFLDDDARFGETYSVSWAAPNPGLAPGVKVLFEYVLEAAPERRVLQVQYDFKTVGPRKAVFAIPWKDYRAGGNVKAWRVQIVHAGRLLTEQASPDWKIATDPAQAQKTEKPAAVRW